MATNASDVARYVVNLCIKDRCPISNLQLQKILFFCQIESYRIMNRPLFPDDFEAWRYGPVIPSIYRLFSIFGGMKISREVVSGADIDALERQIVDRVAAAKRQLRPWELVGETHESNSPWDLIYKNGAGDGQIIPKQLIAQSARSR